MKHLYELTDQMLGLQNLIEEGEMDPEILQDTLDGLEGDIQAKGESTLAVLANLGSSIEAFDTEIRRMQARKRTLENNLTWLKEYLRENMSKAGITKIESPLFTASLRAPSKVVEIVDQGMLLDPYVTTVTTTKINRTLISKDLKAGVDVPGAKLVDGKSALLIK